MSEDMHYASKGVGNAGLALGIIGTALGAINWGDLGAGLVGGNSNKGYCQSFEGKVSALESEIAKLQAQRYSDEVAWGVYQAGVNNYNKLDDKINSNFEKLYGFVLDLDKKTALNTQALQYENKLIECRIDKNKQLGELADASIISYVNATFLPGTLKLPITSICPQPTTATTTDSTTTS